jgi:cytochrome c-type biogenesis protein CcmF
MISGQPECIASRITYHVLRFMPQIAHFSLILALLCAIYAIAASIIGLGIQSKRWIKSAANALYAITSLLTLAVFLLLYFLLQRDFQLAYVASYTDISLPTLYTISALWAGQEGSLLFWGWGLSLCSAFFIRKYKHVIITSLELPYIYIVLSLVLGFFLVILTFTANPFQQLPFIPIDGDGMNPLLQNLYMALHPPMLFIGYAGFIIPFALAFAALCTGKIGNEWIWYGRRWTLFSWYFLGIGILLGARWAYLELGWGGYWGWDPVENSSFIPWIISTALIHTLILQQRKGLLKRWNIFLCILTFSLCVFGTFITRSGILTSVHAFAQSPIGYYFLVFLITTSLCTLGLMVYRWKELQSSSDLDSIVSKEGSFFLANQLLVGFGVAVLYGTVYPLFSEFIIRKKFDIGPSFFNLISLVLGLVLLGLIGMCQLIPWKNISLDVLRNKLLIPLGITLIGTFLLFVLGMKNLSRDLPPLLTCSLGIFVFTTICVDIKQSFFFKKQKKFPKEKSASRTMFSQKHRYAGYVFHVGTILIAIGIVVSSAYKLEQEVTLQPGGVATLGDFQFRHEYFGIREDEEKGVAYAEIAVLKNEREIAMVRPEKRFYRTSSNTQITTEIGLHSSLKEDIYVILAGWEEDQTTTFVFIINPMISGIWLGGFLMFTIGMLILMLPTLRIK